MKKDKLSLGKEFMLSVAIHAFVLGGAVALIGHLGHETPPPPVVFLSTELPGGNEGGGSTNSGVSQKAPMAQARKKTRAPSNRRQEKRVSLAKSEDKQTDVPDTKALEEHSPTPLVSEGISEGTTREAAGSGGGGGGFGYGSGGGGGSGGGTGKGHGTGSGDANILAEQYLARHFAYIRNLIMKNLRYPRIARKMGWRGKVVVAFVIKQNGGVEGSKILTSSGYEVLDSQVLAVISQVQPFPRPPVRAELILPVVYRLE